MLRTPRNLELVSLESDSFFPPLPKASAIRALDITGRDGAVPLMASLTDSAISVDGDHGEAENKTSFLG